MLELCDWLDEGCKDLPPEGGCEVKDDFGTRIGSLEK